MSLETITATINTQYEIWHSGAYYKINDNTYETNLSYTFTTPSSLTIFGMKEYTSSNEYVLSNDTVDIRYSSAKLYLFEIYEDDELEMQLVPCYRKSDIRAGLYDTVNNVFYPSSTATQLTSGTDAR